MQGGTLADAPNRLVGLKLALDALGVETDTSTFQNRLALQKAAYLAQAAGLNLGYRHTWYRKGPYSPDLTRDYFALAETPDVARGYKLRDDVDQRLRAVAAYTLPPTGVTLTRDNWLELLASVHYLRKKIGRSEEQAAAVIAATKPHLARYVNEAEAALETVNLL